MKSTDNIIPRKVGEVEILVNVDPAKIVYEDGAEKELLEIFSTDSSEKKVNEILAGNPSWPIYYHLSKKRGAVIDWYNFKEGASVLEIGAGCGAITESLVKKNVSVTALEVDPSRALVNAHRNKGANNLKVVVENLENFESKEKFDYVVCIGVLEYSGRYISGENPYRKFLSTLINNLKPGGILLLAIENKTGLKYVAGAPEDHTGVIFDSFNNYPSHSGIKTFSKKELFSLIQGAGFNDINFYFPHPDYKLPHAVFSQQMFPGNNIESPLGLYPTTSYQDRKYLFSEQAFMMTVEKEKIYPFFANSYIVEASSSQIHNNQIASYFTQVDRRAEFAISTSILPHPDTGKFIVRKQAITPASNHHISNMLGNGKRLSESKKLQKLLKISRVSKHYLGSDSNPGWVEYEMLPGTTLERKFLESIINLDQESAIKITNRLINAINSLDAKKLNPNKQQGYNAVFGDSYNFDTWCVNPGVIDMNLDNIIENNDNWSLFDYEWVFDYYIPRDYIVGRIFLLFFRNKYSDLIRRHYESIKLVEPLSDMVVPEYIYEIEHINQLNLKECYIAECNFQSYVYGKTIKPDNSIIFYEQPKPVETHESFITYVNSLEKNMHKTQLTLTDQHELINAQQAEIENLRSQLKDPAVRGYKKARSIAKKVIKRK